MGGRILHNLGAEQEKGAERALSATGQKALEGGVGIEGGGNIDDLSDDTTYLETAAVAHLPHQKHLINWSPLMLLITVAPPLLLCLCASDNTLSDRLILAQMRMSYRHKLI